MTFYFLEYFHRVVHILLKETLQSFNFSYLSSVFNYCDNVHITSCLLILTTTITKKRFFKISSKFGRNVVHSDICIMFKSILYWANNKVLVVAFAINNRCVHDLLLITNDSITQSPWGQEKSKCRSIIRIDKKIKHLETCDCFNNAHPTICSWITLPLTRKSLFKIN